jgi:hypothetical protein
MDDNNLYTVINFIQKKKDMEGKNFVTDPKLRDKLIQKKIQKFLLKRQGKDYS